MIQPTRTDDVLQDVYQERKRQDKQWGPVNLIRPISIWLSIIGEEYGEACQAFLQSTDINPGPKDFDDLRKELVECAGVCVAAIETLDNLIRLKKKVT